ncbi:hypothetical protein L2U69_11760 [Zavarzinia compransoris]|uniref:hypothetical protein n=1 Tax=Zavarzinia marina TaxID=2911065 RepID=UPI001F22F0BE|nr:hypothetical protein [Zavarzinia marina]MCF4166322.1 hypothetical protein [Zavarzinia marina]
MTEGHLTAAFMPDIDRVVLAGTDETGARIITPVSTENADVLARQLVDAIAEQVRFRAQRPGRVGLEGE